METKHATLNKHSKLFATATTIKSSISRLFIARKSSSQTIQDTARTDEDNSHSTHDAVKTVIQHFGGQTKLAQILGVTQGSVSAWLNRDKCIPINYALIIEQYTKCKIDRYQMRPDVYGQAPSASLLARQLAVVMVRNTTRTISHSPKTIAVISLILGAGLAFGVSQVVQFSSIAEIFNMLNIANFGEVNPLINNNAPFTTSESVCTSCETLKSCQIG